MNKITYFVITLILMLSSASALEKKDCTGLKKLSKALKAIKVKKPKIKKPKIKSSGDRVIKGSTKQYPKGIKK